LPWASGNFLNTSHYEQSFNHGHLNTFYSTRGNVITAKYNLSVNALHNTAGQIVYRINTDAITTDGEPACAPINLFG
jgi:hypothetical protein